MGQNISHVSNLPDLTAEVTIIIKNSDLEPTKFTGPRGLLIEHSEFFEEACRTEDPEASTRVIRLDDVEPDTFTWYLMWVYRGKAVTASGHDPDDEKWAERLCGDLVRLWLLADRLGNQWCRNAAMDNIVDIVNHQTKCEESIVFSPSVITLIWSATEAHSPLRRVLLTYFLSHDSYNEIQHCFELLPLEFIKELVFEALGRFMLGRPGSIKQAPSEAVEAPQCFYHDHWEPFSRTCAPDKNLIRNATAECTSLPAIFDLTRTMTIVINEDGPEQYATFTIPEALLVEKSEFFGAACRNAWKESSSRTIKISEVNVDAFYAYMYWIYWEMVPVSTECKKSFHSAAEKEPTLNHLVELWLLADRFADTQLRDLTMDALRKIAYSIYSAEKNWIIAFPPDMTARIWSSTTRGRALRRFVVDVYDSRVTESNLNGVKQSSHPDFLVDLATK